MCVEYVSIRVFRVTGLRRGRALLALQEGGDVESAAILTPYTGQVRLITNMLRQQGLEQARPMYHLLL